MRRKEKLAVGKVYHIFNKSIADFKIFTADAELLRMKNLIKYYQVKNMPLRFSHFMNVFKESGFNKNFISVSQGKEKFVQIIAYCIMPTHLHLILKQLEKDGISIFMSKILNSYARYFNVKYKRKGPLWEGNFKNVLVNTDEQLLHLTRYIHLNPITAYLVDKPEHWPASSYRQYLSTDDQKICNYDNILEIKPNPYREFVEDRVSYQRELARIKELFLED